MPNEFEFLLQDPRPDLPGDTKLWEQLFRQIPLIQDRQAACQLSSSLWHLRAWGTMLRRDERYRLKLTPYIHPVDGWDSEELFKEITSRHLTPYAENLKMLLSQCTKGG